MTQEHSRAAYVNGGSRLESPSGSSGKGSASRNRRSPESSPVGKSRQLRRYSAWPPPLAVASSYGSGVIALARRDHPSSGELAQELAIWPRAELVADPELSRSRSVLRHLDADGVSELARVESRNREVHLPPVSVYRWWARRTAAVNGAVIDAFTRDHPGTPLVVADPFAGGGVIPLAAATRGHRVYAQDLNPWAAAGLASMLALPAADALREATAVLHQRVLPEVLAAYGTTMSDGQPGLISHTFRVVRSACTACHRSARVFPHAMISLLVRKERGCRDAFLACPDGHLFKGTADSISACELCGVDTDPASNYTPGRVVTCACGHAERLERRASSPSWDWEVVLVERSRPGYRELDLPSEGELQAAGDPRYRPERALGAIPKGQETRVLLRHGFREWEDLYPRRQRVLIEHLLEQAPKSSTDPDVVAAVRMAVIGSAEMAGHLSRWDRHYLKSFEAMAGHRFNFTTLAVEPNVWGTVTSGRGTTLRRLAQLVRAAEWLTSRTRRRLVVAGPLNSDRWATGSISEADVVVVQGSSERMLLANKAVDLVLTDPPYHDDVQYSELSLPLRAWAGLSAKPLNGEAVVNAAIGQLAESDAYGALLQRIFAECRRVIRDCGHLIFSYANRSPQAWVDVLGALHRAGFQSIGCEIVHSENETDKAKRGVRACTLDLLLDLVPTSDQPIVRSKPTATLHGEEADFLRVVAGWFLRVGQFPSGWEQNLLADLRSTEFLGGTRISGGLPIER